MQNPIRHDARPRTLAGLAAAVLLTITLTGCGNIVPLEPAAHANDPICANLVVRLPDVVADQPQRETNAQSTSAWGDPASVLLYCGIEPTGPTELQCTSINGVDWIVDDSRAPLYRFEAYGREPGLEVIVDNEAETAVSATTVLMDLEQAVKQLPQTRHCTATDDLTLGEEAGT